MRISNARERTTAFKHNCTHEDELRWSAKIKEADLLRDKIQILFFSSKLGTGNISYPVE